MRFVVVAGMIERRRAMEEFDTDKEERQGAWVVLAMFAVMAAAPPLGCLWMLDRLDRLASASMSSAMGVGPWLGGLAVVGVAAISLSVIGAGLVLYGLVRVQMHGPVYVLGGVLTTAVALSPVLLGWNRIDDIPAVADFDPGDCSICGGELECDHPWPALGPRITARGECRGGRREGEWVFGTRRDREIASFRFAAGLRNGPFETPAVRGSFRDDVRDGEWTWLRSGGVVARGHYVEGSADSRWACLDEESGDELSWVVFERGRVVEGTGDVRRGDDVLVSIDAEDELELEGIACESLGGSPPLDHFERLVSAEPRPSARH